MKCQNTRQKYFSYLQKLAANALLIFAICITSFYNQSFAQTAEKEKSQWAVVADSIYDNEVFFTIPKSWPKTPAHKKNENGFYIAEFIPAGQSVEKWSEMLTVVSYKKIQQNPKQYFSNTYKMTQEICGANTAGSILKEGKDFIIGILMCGKLSDSASNFGGLKKDQGEMALYKIYKVGNSIYSVFYSWRGKSYDVLSKNDDDFPATMKVVKNYITTSGPVGICNKINPTKECSEIMKAMNR